jgi:hypothetical protein
MILAQSDNPLSALLLSTGSYPVLQTQLLVSAMYFRFSPMQRHDVEPAFDVVPGAQVLHLIAPTVSPYSPS